MPSNKTNKYNFTKYKWIIILSITILFRIKFEIIFENFLINPLLSFVKTGILNDLLFIIILIIIFIWYYKKWKSNFIYSKDHVIIALAIFFLLIVYRIYTHNWVWTELSILPLIKYADLLFVPPCFIAIIYLSNKKKVETKKNAKSFEVDTPIKSTNVDYLNMSPYAHEIAIRITTLNTEKSFAIGITGSYGSGKTSFMELIKEILKKDYDKHIILDFNPWLSRNENAIIEDFFETVSNELKKYTSISIHSIKKYSNKLSELDGSTIGKTLALFNNPVGATNSLGELFNQVNSIFKRIDKKVIIFIDDIDRLTYSEIFETLKLIRTTADFHNVAFVAAYDKSYVISAIHHSINSQSNYFLEKIFQAEFTLPFFERSRLIKILKDKLLQITDDQFYLTEIKDYVESSEIDSNKFLSDYLFTVRDITRFYNNLLIDYNLLKGEVEFGDLFQIELIKLKFPNVYELLFDKMSEIFENTSGNDPQNIKLIDNYDNVNRKRTFPFKEILSANMDFYGVTESQIEKIIKFLNSIFNDRDWSFKFREKPHLSIRNRNQFHTYNAFRVLEGNLSEVEYLAVRNGSYETFSESISEWIDKDFRYPLIRRLKQEKQFENKEEFEKIIKSIFYLTKQEAAFEKGTVNISYDEKDLMDKMYGVDSISNKFYGSNVELYKEFLRSILTNPPAPYVFEASFIFFIIRNDYEFAIEKSELEVIRLNYLKRYLSEAVDFKYAWSFYGYCNKIERISTGNSTIKIQISPNEKANEILIHYLKINALDWFLYEIITTGRGESDTQIMISTRTINEIFGTLEEFEKFLTEIDEGKWKYLKEFNSLFAKFKETGFDKPIDFEFKVIPGKRFR